MPKDPIKSLEAIERNLDRKLAKVLNEMAFRIRNRVKGPPGLLQWKSRRIPVVVEKAKLVGQVMTAVVRGASGWKWGHVHIGPPGSTTIKAAKGMLAIPTDFARKGFRGKTLGPKQYAGTRIFAGIVWGKAGWGGARTGGGLRQRRAAGEKFTKESLIPLFILKSSVVVRRRIIPADLIRWIRPQLRGELIKGGLLKP
jgi:hypothetical protein